MDCSMDLLQKIRWHHFVLVIVVVSSHLASGRRLARNLFGCPCNPIGTHNFESCNSTVTSCPCIDGFTGPYCTECSSGYFRSNTTQECLPCSCNQQGSLSSECIDSTGSCACIPGVGGVKCNECTADAHWWDGQKCLPCECNDFLHQCHGSAASEMCRVCSAFPAFAARCNVDCRKGYHQNTNGTCSMCPPCQKPEGNATDARHPECQLFAHRCLKTCSHSAAALDATCATCHKFSSTWNCTKIEAPGEQPARRGSSKKDFRNYYVYIAAGGGVLLCTAIISTVIFLRRRNNDQKPTPLWTMELKQEDQESFTDSNELDDVLFLDDSYLMEPSDVFTTSTETMDERIGYKPWR